MSHDAVFPSHSSHLAFYSGTMIDGLFWNTFNTLLYLGQWNPTNSQLMQQSWVSLLSLSLPAVLLCFTQKHKWFSLCNNKINHVVDLGFKKILYLKHDVHICFDVRMWFCKSRTFVFYSSCFLKFYFSLKIIVKIGHRSKQNR